MESSVTIANMVALFGTMAALAAVPSVSVLVVSARSATSGFVHGVFTAVGIVVGDLLFILLAVFGLALLVEAMGSMFFLVKYIGGAYLIWLGTVLWRAREKITEISDTTGSSLRSSFRRVCSSLWEIKRRSCSTWVFCRLSLTRGLCPTST